MSTPGKIAWLLTINNPEGAELNPVEALTRSAIRECIRYIKWGVEVGEREETQHIHIYVHLLVQQRFSALKAVFPRAHIDALQGTPQQAIDYVGNPEFIYSTENPDSAKAGKRKGGVCISQGEWGSITGIKLNKAANGGGKGQMENRLLKLKEDIDARKPIEELWQADFYVMCKNFSAVNNYYACVNGVSLKQKIEERDREGIAEHEEKQREVLRELYKPLTEWPQNKENGIASEGEHPF